jgi:hypothetical protein
MLQTESKAVSMISSDSGDGVAKASTSVSSKVNFRQLTSLLEQISKIDEVTVGRTAATGKNQEKKKLLQKFIQSWRTIATNLTSSVQPVDGNFFPVMRFLLPADDRRVYGLKETKLAKHLIDALVINSKR